MKFKNAPVFLLFALIFWAPSLMGQTAGTGALTGTVTDSSGAVVLNATVTATNIDTGQARTRMTGSNGIYTFSLLPPGMYRLRIEASGFRPVDVPSATVTVTETAVLDRSLEVGAQNQAVTVKGEVEAVETTSSAVGGVVTAQTATELPLSSRNYTSLLAMTAGANSDVVNATTMGKDSTTISVNGADVGQNVYLQDGVAVNSFVSGNTTQESTGWGAFPIPNPDTIQEFKVQTSTYDAGYGRNPGANVNVITKSGTNDFHGTAFEFFRNTDLNANDWFRNATGGSRQVLNENQFGGTIGGPIKKDKLFFFISYQETQEKNGIAGFGYSIVTLPPIPTGSRGTCALPLSSLSACDATAQLFAQNLGAAFCPQNNSGPSNVIGTPGSVAVACSGANINPVALKILQLQLPKGGYLIPGSGGNPSSPSGGYQLASYSIPASYANHQGMGNWDYVIDSKNTLSGRYYFETDPESGAFASNGSRITNTVILPGDPVSEQKTNQTALLRLTSILSNNLVNQASFSYQRLFAVASSQNPFTNSQIGLPDLTPGVDKLTDLSIGGLFSASGAIDSTSGDNQFDWADQISWEHGKHSIRTGFEVERLQGFDTSPGEGAGGLAFRSFPDFLIGAAGNCGPAVAPSAANPAGCNGGPFSSVVSAAGVENANFPYAFRAWYLDGFVQDDVKLTPRLTLNLGLRWEWDGFPVEKYGDSSSIWPSLLNTVPNPGSGCVLNGQVFGLGPAGTGCSLAGLVVPSNYKGPIPPGVYRNATSYLTQTGPPWDDFAPRVGFAWRPTSSNRFVMRGGGGYFYDLIDGIQSLLDPLTGIPGEAFTPKGVPSQSLANPWVLSTTVPSAHGTLGFPARWVDFSTGNNSEIFQDVGQQNETVPVTYEWGLNIQYEFVTNWVLELGYVGSHGIHQEQTGIGPAIPWNWASLASPSNPINGITTNSSTNVTLRVPYLGISTASGEDATNGAYKYNALEATMRKRFSHGLQFQAAYTYDAAFDTEPYGINTPPYVILPYGRNTIYHPQRFIVNYIWDLPFGQQKGILGKALEGWSVSGVTTIQDGAPFSIYDSAGGAVFFEGGAGAVGGATNFDAPAQFCPGFGIGNVKTKGNLSQVVRSGLNGGAGYLNPAAFCPLPVLSGTDPNATGYGNSGVGDILAPGQFNWDISLAKLTKIHENQSLQFRAEFFNAFNHPQFSFATSNDTALANQDASSGSFGVINTSSVNPRLIQFALKFLF